MTFKSKYIIIDGHLAIAPVVFAEFLNHSDVARAIAPSDKVLGAGFCYIENNQYVCYGESISLQVKSRGAEDSIILNRVLGATK